MKKRLKLGFWLLAWSCWLWLGFGLHRELPRDLGPPTCKLTFDEKERFLGWLGDDPLAVSIEELPSDDENVNPTVVRLWNAESGRLTKEIAGPIHRGSRWDVRPFLQHGLIAAAERPESPGRSTAKSTSILHLTTGKWIEVPIDLEALDEVAPSKPFALFSRQGDRQQHRIVDGVKVAADPEAKEWLVLVVDLRDGSVVFKLTPNVGGQPPRESENENFFVGDDAVAVQTTVVRQEDREWSPDDTRIEIWRFDSPTSPIKVLKGFHTDHDVSVSKTGRVAWHSVGKMPAHVDVFDLNLGKMVLSTPPKGERRELLGGISGSWPGPVIAAGGRSVYVPMMSELREVDGGRVLWKNDESAVWWKANGCQSSIPASWPL